MISVVIPVYNEEAVLPALFARLYPALDALSTPYEVIFVNDGSLDRSAKSADAVLGRIERGEGMLGRMSKDDSLYVNANEAVANLNKAVTEITKLTQDIRREPKRYLKISVF